MSKRILKERAMLEKSPLPFIAIINLAGEDIFNWECTLVGPEDSPYQGGLFVLSLAFPAQYPFKAPQLRFKTKVYHPSVSRETGEICADVIGNWGPTLNAKHCLEVVYSLLQSPEADHPVEDEIAQQLREKPKEFEKTARKYTKDFAK
ncbi:MAG: hypothetical protein SGBAC_008290 [Bacillariaceae sp.]